MLLDFQPMKNPPEQPEDVAWYGRDVLLDWFKRHPDAKDPDLAKEIHSTKQTVGKIRKGETRVGTNFAMKMADLAGVTWEEFKKRAAQEFKQRGGETRTEYDERYPNRAAVIEVLKDELHPETIKRAGKGALDSDSDMSRSEWFDEIRTFDRRVRRELENPAAEASARAARRKQVESALDDEDVPKPR